MAEPGRTDGAEFPGGSVIRLLRDGATCDFFSFGAHLVNWKPVHSEENMLWISNLSDHLAVRERPQGVFLPKPIRGIA